MAPAHRDAQSVIRGAAHDPGFAPQPPPPEPDPLSVARAQRFLLWHVLALLLVTAGQCVAPVNAPAWMAAAKLSIYVVVTVLTIARAVNLSIAIGGRGAMTWVVAMLLFIPLLNLALLASLNARATDLLRAQGIRVGVMGAPLTELAKLRPGVCRACGYDLTGLADAPCPECGAPRLT